MRKLLFNTLLAGALLIGSTFAQAATDAKTELKQLVEKVKTQLKQGKTAEKDLEPLLKEFDLLLDAHKTEKTDDVARVLLMKGMLYLQVIENTEKGLELFKQLKKDFPDTPSGKSADNIIEAVAKREEIKKVQKSLVAGVPFPDFNEKDLTGKALSPSKLKGKVVLIDFWATWCGPCVEELPNVLKTYEKYHEKGFEIVGISLDKEEKALTEFIKTKGMAWPQYFDGKGWQNKLAMQYGVDSIPATFLLDREGKIAAKDLRGEALDAEVGKLLKPEK